MSFIYLASPMAHPARRMRRERFQQTVDATARLIIKGHVIFSPIVHNFALTIKSDLQMGFEYWRKYDLTMIDAASELWILNLDGWAASVGIAAEVIYAQQTGKPLWFVDYETLKVTAFVPPTPSLDDHDNAIEP